MPVLAQVFDLDISQLLFGLDIVDADSAFLPQFLHEVVTQHYVLDSRTVGLISNDVQSVEFSTISTLESVISVSSDYLCINWNGSSLGVYTRVGIPRLQCLGQLVQLLYSLLVSPHTNNSTKDCHRGFTTAYPAALPSPP